MTFRMIMVRLMEEGTQPALAAAFSRHDATGFGEQIGVAHRSLYSYHGIYLHLVEAESDLRPVLASQRDNPVWRTVDKEVTSLLSPVDPRFPSMPQAQASCFYTWDPS